MPAAIAVVGVAALVFWKFSSDRKAILARLALAACLTVLPAGLAFGFLDTFAPPPPSAQPGVAYEPPPLPPGDYPAGPLASGDKVPPFEGWLNGAPPAASADAPRLTVVDIWAYWCPGCRETAPGLVEVYHQYKDRRVAIVSVTNMPRASAEEFVESFAVPWPCAYGATIPTLARFGAYNSAMKMMRGYEVKLVIYLVGADGRVLWNDASARMLHQDPRLVVQQLVDQIDRALAAASSDADKGGK